MFKVSITSRAERELKRLDRPVKNRIVSTISALASDPRPPGCLKARLSATLSPKERAAIRCVSSTTLSLGERVARCRRLDQPERAG